VKTKSTRIQAMARNTGLEWRMSAEIRLEKNIVLSIDILII